MRLRGRCGRISATAVAAAVPTSAHRRRGFFEWLRSQQETPSTNVSRSVLARARKPERRVASRREAASFVYPKAMYESCAVTSYWTAASMSPIAALVSKATGHRVVRRRHVEDGLAGQPGSPGPARRLQRRVSDLTDVRGWRAHNAATEQSRAGRGKAHHEPVAVDDWLEQSRQLIETCSRAGLLAKVVRREGPAPEWLLAVSARWRRDVPHRASFALGDEKPHGERCARRMRGWRE